MTNSLKDGKVFGGYKYELKANIDEVLKEYFLGNKNLK
jgi:hypothetical protein